jgi:hypothetical protein
MAKKFQVIKVDCGTNDVEILATHENYSSSTEFLTIYLKKNFDLNDFCKCVHNNNSSVSIYEYGYIFPKRLSQKIHIVEFEDI